MKKIIETVAVVRAELSTIELAAIEGGMPATYRGHSSGAAKGTDLSFGSPRTYRSGGPEPLVNGPTRPYSGGETSSLPPRTGQEFSSGRRDKSEGSNYTSLFGR
jgi:hypothetical protein